jgi:Tfp pilus assembly protein PilF
MRSVAENNIGLALQANGQIDMAVDHYRKALSLRSDDAQIYNNLGTALRAQGRPHDAVATYQLLRASGTSDRK